MTEVRDLLKAGASLAAATGAKRAAALFTRAVDEIERLEARFAEHLEAWRVNSATSLERIEDLQRQLAQLSAPTVKVRSRSARPSPVVLVEDRGEGFRVYVDGVEWIPKPEAAR